MSSHWLIWLPSQFGKNDPRNKLQKKEILTITTWESGRSRQHSWGLPFPRSSSSNDHRSAEKSFFYVKELLLGCSNRQNLGSQRLWYKKMKVVDRFDLYYSKNWGAFADLSVPLYVTVIATLWLLLGLQTRTLLFGRWKLVIIVEISFRQDNDLTQNLMFTCGGFNILINHGWKNEQTKGSTSNKKKCFLSCIARITFLISFHLYFRGVFLKQSWETKEMYFFRFLPS